MKDLKEFLKDEWELAKSRPVWTALSFLIGVVTAATPIIIARV